MPPLPPVLPPHNSVGSVLDGTGKAGKVQEASKRKWEMTCMAGHGGWLDKCSRDVWVERVGEDALSTRW